MAQRRKSRFDPKVRSQLAFSVLCYVLALILPAYSVDVTINRLDDPTSLPLTGWQCLQIGYVAWVPWSANFLLLATWSFMIFWKKWTLPPAVATMVLALSLIAMDPARENFHAGSAFWYLSMVVPIAFGLKQIKRKTLPVRSAIVTDFAISSARPIEQREQFHVR